MLRLHTWMNNESFYSCCSHWKPNLRFQQSRSEKDRRTCNVRTQSWSFLGFESELVSRDDFWGCWHRSADRERVKTVFMCWGQNWWLTQMCVFKNAAKWYMFVQTLGGEVSLVPFCCLVVLATWFITRPSMSFWMRVGDEETRLNSSQLSLIFCSTFSSSAARPARSISFTQTARRHNHAVRLKCTTLRS